MAVTFPFFRHDNWKLKILVLVSLFLMYSFTLPLKLCFLFSVERPSLISTTLSENTYVQIFFLAPLTPFSSASSLSPAPPLMGCFPVSEMTGADCENFGFKPCLWACLCLRPLSLSWWRVGGSSAQASPHSLDRGWGGGSHHSRLLSREPLRRVTSSSQFQPLSPYLPVSSEQVWPFWFNICSALGYQKLLSSEFFHSWGHSFVINFLGLLSFCNLLRIGALQSKNFSVFYVSFYVLRCHLDVIGSVQISLTNFKCS